MPNDHVKKEEGVQGPESQDSGKEKESFKDLLRRRLKEVGGLGVNFDSRDRESTDEDGDKEIPAGQPPQQTTSLQYVIAGAVPFASSSNQGVSGLRIFDGILEGLFTRFNAEPASATYKLTHHDERYGLEIKVNAGRYEMEVKYVSTMIAQLDEDSKGGLIVDRVSSKKGSKNDDRKIRVNEGDLAGLVGRFEKWAGMSSLNGESDAKGPRGSARYAVSFHALVDKIGRSEMFRLSFPNYDPKTGVVQVKGEPTSCFGEGIDPSSLLKDEGWSRHLHPGYRSCSFHEHVLFIRKVIWNQAQDLSWFLRDYRRKCGK